MNTNLLLVCCVIGRGGGGVVSMDSCIAGSCFNVVCWINIDCWFSNLQVNSSRLSTQQAQPIGGRRHFSPILVVKLCVSLVNFVSSTCAFFYWVLYVMSTWWCEKILLYLSCFMYRSSIFFTHLQPLHTPPSETHGYTHPHLTCTQCGHTKATTPCWSILCGDGWRRYCGGSLISNWWIWCWTYSSTWNCWMIHGRGLFWDHQFVVNILHHARTRSVFCPTW